MPYISIVEFIDLIAKMSRSERLHRGGIIPYTTGEINGFTYTFYCLGLDYSSGNITDFAGKREPRDRDIIETSIREFQEETLGVFGPLRREDLIRREASVLYDHQSATIFVPFNNIDMMRIVDNYTRSTRGLRSEPELSMLVWMDDYQLRMALMQNKQDPIIFYYPTGRLLSQIFSDEETEQCEASSPTTSSGSPTLE